MPQLSRIVAAALGRLYQQPDIVRERLQIPRIRQLALDNPFLAAEDRFE
jgi:hypothetical protein